MLRKTLVGIAVAALLAGGALAQEKNGGGARERLKEAWNIKKTSFKKEGEIKRSILLQTVNCYRSLLNDFPEDKSCCAEACFRMGEIFRSLKMTKEAREEFNRTFAYDKRNEFAARSWLEIGHLHRREKAYKEALACYQRVMDECPDQRDTCADAFTWIGKVYLKIRDADKARKTLIAFAEKFPELPDEAIRNIDLAAGSLLDEGKIDDASALLNHWRQHFETVLGKDRGMDKRITKALERMKTPDRIKAEEEGKD